MLQITPLPCVAQLKFETHDREICALEWHPKLPNMLATGSRDNYIKVRAHISVPLFWKLPFFVYSQVWQVARSVPKNPLVQ